jgi:hypothetical protein
MSIGLSFLRFYRLSFLAKTNTIESDWVWLSETAHPLDSQTNEALNQSVVTYAPKHKNYSKTPP